MKPDELRNRFAYHPPHGDQVERYTRLRSHGLYLAGLIESVCPESRERSLAMTRLEEAVMWANAAIARHEPPPEPQWKEIEGEEEPGVGNQESERIQETDDWPKGNFDIQI